MRRHINTFKGRMLNEGLTEVEKDKKILKLEETVRHQQIALSKIGKSVRIIMEELEKDHSSNYGDIYLQSYLERIYSILNKYKV